MGYKVYNINTKGHTAFNTIDFINLEECNDYFNKRPGLSCLYKTIYSGGSVHGWEGAKLNWRQ